jgi:hypothetical protein
MGAIRRAGAPPASKAYIPVWRIRTREPVRFILLSPSVWAYWTHYANRRTHPCRSNEHDVCRCRLREFPLRWKGFLCALNMKGQFGFVEVTGEQAISIVAQADDGKTLRGLCYDLSRTSDNAGSRGRALRVTHVVREPDTLPQDQDPEALLMKLWDAPPRAGMNGTT